MQLRTEYLTFAIREDASGAQFIVNEDQTAVSERSDFWRLILDDGYHTELTVHSYMQSGRVEETDSGLVVVSTPEGSAPAEQQQTSVVSVLSSGCVANQLEWLAPVSGDVIEGSYTLEATVNVQDMAFYNWAFSPVGDQMNWQTLSAGNLPVIEGPLGLWATTQVANGDYVLRLTVYDLNNEQLPPCDVYIRVLNEE